MVVVALDVDKNKDVDENEGSVADVAGLVLV